MGHGLETSIDKGAFMIEAPWHIGETGADGRAVVYDYYMSLAESIANSSLSTAKVTEASITLADGTPIPYSAHLGPDGRVYAIVKAGTPVVQYSEIFAPLENIMQRHGLRVSSAATIHGGAYGFLCMEFPEPFNIVHGDGRSDKHYSHLTAQAAQDGSVGIGIILMDYRTVCNNTRPSRAAAADRERARTVRKRGSSEATLNRWLSAIDSLDNMLETQIAQRSVLSKLAVTPMNLSEFQDFSMDLLINHGVTHAAEQAALKARFTADPIERNETVRRLVSLANDPDKDYARAQCKVMGIGPGEAISRRTANLVAERATTLSELFVKGKGNRGADCYDALCAVTEYVDHFGTRRHRGEGEAVSATRYVSATIGEGAAFKDAAFQNLASRVQ